MSYTCILTETRDAVGLITLNRPKVLNALNMALVGELALALDDYESDDAIGAVVLTGGPKAFAAGADIAEMVDRNYADMLMADDFSGAWDRLARMRKPVIAAVGGYALGGGCEIAMMCDLIIASEDARFGQPEIKLGVLPGIGGTQRLTRAVGKAKAMDLCLTGRMMGAEEAERAGLVSRVVPAERLLDEALEAAQTVASMSRPAVYLTKEAVDRSHELTLAEGCRYERRVFQAAFALEDKREGMRAFLEKRTPAWRHR